MEFVLGGRSSSYILTSIGARKMNWQNHVSCVGYRTGHTSFYVVNRTVTDHAGGAGVNRYDIIKMHHRTSWNLMVRFGYYQTFVKKVINIWFLGGYSLNIFLT
jgi:hypothetical protein